LTRLIGVILAAVVAAVLALPLLLVGAFGLGGSGAVSAQAGGSDAAQLAAVPAELREAFLDAARRYALPPALLAAVGKVESGFDPAAVGPPVPGGPALGMMQFLHASWERFNPVPGASPFEPGPAVLAAAEHLLSSGRLPGGAWDAARALLGYNRSAAYVRTVLAQAAEYGYRYSPHGPPLDGDRYTFPVAGPVSYGAAHHDYPATDIFAPIGAPVLAAVRAEVLRLSRTDRGKGGLSVTLRGEDGWRYYYAHLSTVRSDLSVGDIVEAGELLGANGNSGNARTTPPHLHLGISQTGSVAGQLSPYPYLQVWPRTAP
jgi:murein DD-endopeptidase MepM/ murein hydrolase activator NlpD